MSDNLDLGYRVHPRFGVVRGTQLITDNEDSVWIQSRGARMTLDEWRALPPHFDVITVRDLQLQIGAWAREKGWGDPLTSTEAIATKLCLIHSEVSEALEALREGKRETYEGPGGKPEGLPSELADTVIRCLQLADALKIDLQAEIIRKHRYNLTRPYRHGGKAV